MLKNDTINIALTDDDEDDILLFQEAVDQIENLSVNLSIYNHGRHLCERLVDTVRKPDVILLDINMPIMNGKECLKYIRSVTAFDDVPVIMYSTALSPDDIDLCYSYGASLYIPKPNTFDALCKIVEDISLKIQKGDLLVSPFRENFLYKY